MEKKLANRIAIANIDIVAANKEAQWALPRNCVWFTMQCRTGVDVRIATIAKKAEDSEKPYGTMKAGASWDETRFSMELKTGLPIFFAADSPVVVEIFMGVHDEEEV